MYFLQISDTHFLQDYHKNPDFFYPAFANLHSTREKLLALQEKITQPLSFISHCGDLCHRGELEDYQALREIFQEIFPDTPMIFTAGNHDRGQFLQEAFYGKIRDFYAEEHTIDGLRILSFDNSNGVPNSGEITEKTATWLLKKLKEQPQQDTILMSHHHALTEQSPMPPVVTHPLFQEVLQQKNILAYLTGHSHCPFVGKWEEIPYYTVGSFCFQTEDLGEGKLNVSESSAYHLFSYENHQVSLVKGDNLGIEQFLAQVQKP